MPQYPVTVYDSEGNPAVMHSVDAKEAVQLGDYTYAPPGDKPDPEKLAAARAKFETGQAVTHPELLTEEDRTKQREAANAQTVPVVTIPTGSPVVLQQGEVATQPQTRPETETSSRRRGATEERHA